MGGFRLIGLSAGTAASPSWQITSDSDTGGYRPAADTIGIVGAGVDVARFVGATGGVNYVEFRSQSAGQAPQMRAAGSDTNVALRLMPVGTGYVQIATAGGLVSGGNIVPGLAFVDDRDGFVQTTAGTITAVTRLREAFRISGVASATNYVQVTPAAASGTPFLDVAGADTNIDLELRGKGSGHVTTATAFLPAFHPTGGSPPVNAVVAQSVPKAWLHYDGVATSIMGSYNVTSVTRASTGQYRATWHTAMGNRNYAVVGTAVGYTSADYRSIVTVDSADTPRTTYVNWAVADGTNTLRDATSFLVVLGMQ